MKIDEIWGVCIDEAKKSLVHDDVPIGAVLLKDGKILAMAHNTRELDVNILGHAEINVICLASKILDSWNLNECELYVTLRPCSMCLEVIKQARIDKVYYLLDKKEEKREYNRTVLQKCKESNYLSYEQMYCEILSSFFKLKR